MEIAQRPDSDDEAGAKLIPEWRVSADDQIIWAGLAALAALLLFFGWNIWRGGDESALSTVSSVVTTSAVGNGAALGSAAATVQAAPAVEASTTTDAPSTTTDAPTTTEASALVDVGDVKGAVAPLAGDITANLNGDTAVLEGFVANQDESDEAEAAAAAVDGIESVENNLVLLEPGVIRALQGAGVVAESANGVGTEMAVGGFVDSDEMRQAAIDATRGVEGVSAVEDNLDLSVAFELNELPQVQFATGSAEILPVSFEDLNAAADLIQGAGEVELAVVGWTDTQGDAQENQALSQARAEAVVTYLVSAGVDGSLLSSSGNGETDQFAAGESPEALQANRVVLFQQTG